MSDIQEEGVWVWMETRSVPKYINWAHDQPNNLENNQDCAGINKDGGWGDFKCADLYNYICETPKAE